MRSNSIESRRQWQARARRVGAKAQGVFDWLKLCRLPIVVDREESIDVLRMLAAAGFIKAEIPPPEPQRDGSVVQPPVTVTALTRDGHAWRASLDLCPATGSGASARVGGMSGK